MSGRVALIGFGFSGLMLSANLVREAKPAAGLTLYILDPKLDALGAAYRTNEPQHLLNVPAGRMGAWAEDHGDFHRWLTSEKGRAAIAEHKLARIYGKDDFVPRLLYGAYLQAIWEQTQVLAAEKKVMIKLVPSLATGISEQADGALAVSTVRGDAIAVDRLVLATGNEPRPVLTQLGERVLQNPWARDALKEAARSKGPVIIIGTGLTAIDAVLSLRAAGYKGEITALSRHALWPRPHQSLAAGYHFEREELLAQVKSLSGLLRFLRLRIAQHEGDWREVIDALRPHTQALWQKLRDKQKSVFLKRLVTYWNVHRHRMAPEIAAKLASDEKLRVIATKQMHAKLEKDAAVIAATDHHGHEEMLRPALVINCTGPELNVSKSCQPLLQQALLHGLIESHATGVGIGVDRMGRAQGVAQERIYTIGSLRTGALLESTAVPELRVQAAELAKELCK